MYLNCLSSISMLWHGFSISAQAEVIHTPLTGSDFAESAMTAGVCRDSSGLAGVPAASREYKKRMAKEVMSGECILWLRQPDDFRQRTSWLANVER